MQLSPLNDKSNNNFSRVTIQAQTSHVFLSWWFDIVVIALRFIARSASARMTLVFPGTHVTNV
ncbi:unnamed protein product [Periconia digitata]|uniref:Uncharacterized protein n=1 Tax=Periconia digitata TaxID=1303443 RepID=A0A9W4UTH8_9PLEO|nr:unnamed protein product [Periconia digitata]